MKNIKPLSLSLFLILTTVLFFVVTYAASIITKRFENTFAASQLELLVTGFISVTVVVGILIITLCASLWYFLIAPLKRVSQVLDNPSLDSGLNRRSIQSLPLYAKLTNSITRMQEELHTAQQLIKSNNSLNDNLTGLPGRFVFNTYLKSAIKDTERRNSTLALVCLDLNHFKEINDSLGHDMGDSILREVSACLCDVLKDKNATIARWGDDEFAILLNNSHLAETQIIASKIANCFSVPFLIDQHRLLISPSIGAALYPLHALDATNLICKANSALQTAKIDRLEYYVFNPKKEQNTVSNISLSSELRQALNDNHLLLYYQPKFSLREKKVIEVEALLRWKHPKRGFISPEEIIRTAETSGLIHSLTEWVISSAIRQQKKWEFNNIDLGMAVNLSMYDLHNPHLISVIQLLISECNTKDNKLILEVTEGAMMRNPALARDILATLDAMKIKIAIDDFGTGYSSLAYLKNLPVDELKIDKSFVLNLKDDDTDLAIVRSTIDLAHNLNLRVVAEGVENQESWNKLEDLGCDLIQGFYLSEPRPATDFEQWYKGYNNINKALNCG